MGGGIALLQQGIANGSYENINWAKVGWATLGGAVSGAILGGLIQGIRVLNAASKWATAGGKSGLKQMSEHYVKHVINEGQKGVAKNIINYTKQAGQFFAKNKDAGRLLRNGVIKIAGAPGGIFNINGLIRSFWYVLL